MGEAICCPDQNSWCYYFNENSSASHLKTFFIDYLKQKNCRKFVWNTDLTSFFQFWTNIFVFFFNLSNWEKKSCLKLGIARLVVWHYLMSRTRYKRNIRITFTTKIPIWKAAELNTENYYIVQFIFKSAAIKKNLEHFSNPWTRKTIYK